MLSSHSVSWINYLIIKENLSGCSPLRPSQGCHSRHKSWWQKVYSCHVLWVKRGFGLKKCNVLLPIIYPVSVVDSFLFLSHLGNISRHRKRRKASGKKQKNLFWGRKKVKLWANCLMPGLLRRLRLNLLGLIYEGSFWARMNLQRSSHKV